MIPLRMCNVRIVHGAFSCDVMWQVLFIDKCFKHDDQPSVVGQLFLVDLCGEKEDLEQSDGIWSRGV